MLEVVRKTGVRAIGLLRCNRESRGASFDQQSERMMFYNRTVVLHTLMISGGEIALMDSPWDSDRPNVVTDSPAVRPGC